MNVLGIETSCDETSIALVKDGKNILSHIIYTQQEHKKYGGILPELASRNHLKHICNIFKDVLQDYSYKDIDCLAVTSEPGLIGSLLVGHNFIKGLSIALDLPYVSVDHIYAHLYAVKLEYDITYPYMGLVLSGGHSLIALVEDFNKIKVIGSTVDDSCGEAFDKVAKHYKLGSGGFAIEKNAKTGDNKAYNFPKPKLKNKKLKYCFSYSGLKNALINQAESFRLKKDPSINDLCASFQKVALDLVIDKFLLALNDYNIKTAVIGGGVASNQYFRDLLNQESKKKDFNLYYPKKELCTDNGAMVAGIAYHYYMNNIVSDLKSKVSSIKKTIF